jgi:hypothetical protein
MSENRYKIRLLPSYHTDFLETVSYICNILHNKTAAENLIDETEHAIISRSFSPLSFEPFPSKKEHVHTYYRIYVKNYTIFYVVIGDVMEVRRLLYNRRNIVDIFES